MTITIHEYKCSKMGRHIFRVLSHIQVVNKKLFQIWITENILIRETLKTMQGYSNLGARYSNGKLTFDPLGSNKLSR